ncbi:SEC14-like protein 2 isoform X2 [Stegodyphus dumicola]|nr:SEC14-like protein 2 isoform X2 [Stegodyphus dumicola]
MDNSADSPCFREGENKSKMSIAHCEALALFKKQISDIRTEYDTDLQLTKVLRARNFNLKKAEKLFREIYCCRQMFEADTIVTTYKKIEVLEKYEYNGFMGFAKNGTPIRYISVGSGDPMGFLKSMSGYELSNFFVYMMLSDILAARKESEKRGKEIMEITYVLDLTGFSIQDHLRECILEIALDVTSIFQEYYPEIWSNVLFVNASYVFHKFYNILKPIIRDDMLKKIEIVSSESTAELLLKYIDEDVLPEFLGGKRRDSKGDPMCKEFLRFGGRIPEKYYLSNRHPLLSSDPGASSRLISAKSCFNFPVVVRKPGSKISLEFRTEGGSISFIILHRKFGPDTEILDLPTSDENLNEKDENSSFQAVISAFRVQTHLAPVDEKIKAPWTGVYVFKFSNSSSWFMSRRLIYRIKLIEPES